jgi:peptidoglycan-associated lipoprotein
MRRVTLMVLVTSLAAAGAAACASKKFVRSSVGATNSKVNALVEALEDTQVRTGRNERRIAEVDAKTGAAARSAEAAHGVASAASSAAKAAGTRLDAIDSSSKRLLYDVALTTDESDFAFGRADLPDAAKVRIDGMVHALIDDPKNVFIEIEGHTDDRGPNVVNTKVGLARAQAVQKYLYDVHQVPLHKMNVISFGEDKPIAPNKTETGRAQNRRVVIRIRA